MAGGEYSQCASLEGEACTSVEVGEQPVKHIESRLEEEGHAAGISSSASLAVAGFISSTR